VFEGGVYSWMQGCSNFQAPSGNGKEKRLIKDRKRDHALEL